MVPEKSALAQGSRSSPQSLFFAIETIDTAGIDAPAIAVILSTLPVRTGTAHRAGNKPA
jgi:hypothetical protein